MVAVILLQQAEGKLVVDQEAVITCSSKWITNITIFRVTQLALITFYPFSGAETLSRVHVTDVSVTAACTSCTLPPVGGVPVVPGQAVLTLPPRGEVSALLTHIVMDAGAVSVTLASWTLDEGPLVVLFSGTKAGVKNHLVVVHSNKLQGSSGRPFDAVSPPRIARVVAPAAPRLLQTLSAGSQAGAILGGAGGGLPLQTLAIREGDDVRVGVHTALGAAAPHALHAVAGAVGAGGPQGARRFAYPRTLIGADNGFFTDKAVHHGRARVGFQAGHRSPLQVGAEPRIVWLAREPLQCGVGKRRHVFPSPVGYVDLAQAYPR